MKGQASLDMWSVVHLATGFLLRRAKLPLWAAVLILVGFEVIEANLRFGISGGTGLLENESQRNIIADVSVGLFGYLLHE